MRIGTKKYEMDNRFKESLTLGTGEKRFGLWLVTTKTYWEATNYRSKHKHGWERIVIGNAYGNEHLPHEQKQWKVYGIGELK